ncbi:hypothetical protein H5968_08015 [Sphaerospermopsis sp. LEGE 00249]|nr:hypothetical protein [Sphaerospermopsis sp. LEGE 00249]
MNIYSGINLLCLGVHLFLSVRPCFWDAEGKRQKAKGRRQQFIFFPITNHQSPITHHQLPIYCYKI